MMRRIAIAFTAVLLVVGGIAPLTAQDERSLPIFLDSTEVNVINVDVIVTDKRGLPVTGLRVGDFELLENGKPVRISNFFAIENGRSVSFELPAPETVGELEIEAPRPPSHLLVYVDNSNMKPLNRARIMTRLREFLRESWREELRVMLASNERSLVIQQGFTDDQRTLFAALDRLEAHVSIEQPYELAFKSLLREIGAVDAETAGAAAAAVHESFMEMMGGFGGSDELVFPSDNPATRVEGHALSLIPQIRAYAIARRDHTKDSIETLRRFIDSAAGVPGRKAVLYVGDGLERRPGEPLFDAFRRRFESYSRVASQFSAMHEAATYDLTGEYQQMIADANAARITFYTIDASGPTQLDRNLASSEARTARDVSGWDLGLASAIDLNEQSTLRMMAEETGGRTAVNPAALSDLLDATLADFENYYSLGYQTPPADGETRILRRLEVRPRNSNLEVRYRRSGVDKTNDERMAEQTMSGLLLDSRENPLQVVLRADEATAEEDGTWVVPVSVQMPIANLVLLPADDAHRAQVALFVAVLDGERRTSLVTKNLCPIRIRNVDLPVSMGRPISCGLRLRMRGGSQRVAVGVRDELAAVESVVAVNVDVGSSGV